MSGLAVGYARIGGAARALDCDTRSFTDRPVPVRDGELVTRRPTNGGWRIGG